MISFFRRALSSWLVLGLLGLVMIAFIVTGVSDPSGMTGGQSRSAVAKIGDERIDASEIEARIQLALENARQENTGLDIATFVNSGAFEQTTRQLLAARAMDVWAREQGMTSSDRLVDGEIASIPAFKGPTGQFDQQVFQTLLRQRRITEKQLRADLAGDLIRRQLLLPVAGGATVPAAVVAPYASLLLERREGMIGIVPTDAMPAGAAPTPAEVEQHYRQTIARYTMPERRIVRYAIFGKDQLGTITKPTEAQIAAFYRANSATYGAKETRTLSQVIVQDQKAAAALVAKVKGGQPFAAAAQAAGFSAQDTALGRQTREGIASLASPAAAAAAFALPKGGITDPVRSELGWHVIHVDLIEMTAAQPLASVRNVIEAQLERQKTDEAIATKVTAIEDAIADGSTFDEVVAAQKLTAATTPAVLPDGRAPEQPAYQAPAELPVLLKAAFESAVEDDPTVETIGNGALHGVIDVTRIIPPAPLPLATVREAVLKDLVAKRAAARARAVAQSILAKVDAGTPMDRAFAEAGMRLPPPQKQGGRQAELARPGQPIPPPLAMMFSMAKGKTKLLPAPGNQGWFVVQLQAIEPGDAAKAPGLIEATRQQFVRVIGEEYVEQFSNAVARDIGVSRDEDALRRLKARLSGAQ